MYSYTWAYQFWPTSKDLFTSAFCGHKMLSRSPTNSDGWQGWMAGEYQETLLSTQLDTATDDDDDDAFLGISAF